MPDFDKAARYVAKQDPPGFLRWLWRNAATPLVFHSWLDARRLALPVEGDLTCDTVAAFCLQNQLQPAYAQIVEVQTESRPNSADRVLSYVIRLRNEWSGKGETRVPLEVTGAVVNLTGPPQPDTVTFLLPGVPACGLRFQVLQ